MADWQAEQKYRLKMDTVSCSVDPVSRILTTYLVPHLQLSDLQQLRQSCLGLRSLVDAASHISWLKAARWEAARPPLDGAPDLRNVSDCSHCRRNTLPEDHPLCTATGSVRLQAEQYAHLHTRLRADTPPKVTSVVLHKDTHALGIIRSCILSTTPSHSGAPLKSSPAVTARTHHGQGKAVAEQACPLKRPVYSLHMKSGHRQLDNQLLRTCGRDHVHL